MHNYKTIRPKSGGGHLGDVVLREVLIKGFDWQNFGVLDRWSLWEAVAYERWSRIEVGLYTSHRVEVKVVIGDAIMNSTYAQCKYKMG